MRLLVTRPEPDASALAVELRALGHEAVIAPLLEFRALDFDPAILNGADGLIFTSRNALRAAAGKLDAARLHARPVFCVGLETERRLRKAGFQNVAAVADTAEELGGKITRTVAPGGKLVHLTGEYQAFDLAQALACADVQVTALRVYTMEEPAAFDPALTSQFKAGSIGGVILMSPRTAEVFATLCGKHGLLDCAKSLHYICLADSMANRLSALKPLHLHIASRPNRAALLALVSTLPTPGQDRVT